MWRALEHRGELLGGQRVSVAESGLLLKCCIISRLLVKGQNYQAVWRSPAIIVTLCVCVCFEIQINGNNQKRWRQTGVKWIRLVCRNTNAKSWFHWEFNKPHQKHITLQNSIFVSPESYKSQHEIHHDFTLLSYKSSDNTLNISQTKNNSFSHVFKYN